MADSPFNIGAIAPDLVAQQAQLARQQQMVDAIRSRAMTPMESQTVTGAGPARVVPISPWQGLAQLFQSGIAAKGQDVLNQKNSEINSQLNQRTADYIRSLAPEGVFNQSQSGSAVLPVKPPSSQDQQGSSPVSSSQNGAGSTLSTQNTGEPNQPTQGQSSGASSAPGLGMAQQMGGQPQMDPAMRNAWQGAIKLSLINPAAGMDIIKALQTPTTEQRNMAAMGQDPFTMGRLGLQKAAKEGLMEAQPNTTIINPMTGKPVYIAPDYGKGTQGGVDASGNAVMGAIPGSQVLSALAGQQTAAQEAAKLPFQSPTVIQTGSGPKLMTPAQQINAANGAYNTPQAQTAPAQGNGLSNAFISALRTTESNNNPNAVSPKGALGSMQVMPATLSNPGFGVQPAKNNSPTELERVGTDYSNALYQKYNGDKTLTSIAYNMGPAATDKWLASGGDYSKLPNETKNYVSSVLTRDSVNSRNQPQQYQNQQPQQHNSNNSETPGLSLMTPEQASINTAKSSAATEAAKVTAASSPLFAAIADAKKLVSKLPSGSLAHATEWVANQPVIGNPETAKATAQWENLMGNFTLNGIASSGLGRMDIPIVNAIEKASQVPMSASPAAKMAALDQIETNLKRHIAASQNLVPQLNQPNLTEKTNIQGMAPVSGGLGGMPNMDMINAELARRAANRGQ